MISVLGHRAPLPSPPRCAPFPSSPLPSLPSPPRCARPLPRTPPLHCASLRAMSQSLPPIPSPRACHAQFIHTPEEWAADDYALSEDRVDQIAISVYSVSDTSSRAVAYSTTKRATVPFQVLYARARKPARAHALPPWRALSLSLCMYTWPVCIHGLISCPTAVQLLQCDRRERERERERETDFLCDHSTTATV